MHTESHPQAGQTVNSPLGEYRIQDWWDRLTGGSWMYADGNPAALNYALRSGTKGLPLDDEVLYGKVGALGYLVHVSEIAAKETGD